MNRKPALSFAVALLALVALACTCSVPNLPNLGGAGPAPKATVPVSQQAVEQMQRKINDAISQMNSTGQFKETFNESEITSYTAQMLQSEQAQGMDIPIQNPQIKLTQGQVWIYGVFQQPGNNQRINGLIIVAPKIQNGKLTAQAVRGDFGPVPVPKPLLDQINQQLQQTIDQAYQQNPNFDLTTLTIREGEIDVAGMIRK